MEFTVSKAELNRALYLTQSIVERKTSMPILVNVLISANAGKLKISASDLDVTALTTAKAEIRSPGSTTLNARVFADIVRELPEGDVTFKLGEGERVEIFAQNARLKMIGVNAEEYPPLPGVSLPTKNKISAAQLLEMIEKTLYAVSFDETRYNLNGVCFELIGSKGKKGEQSLRMVSTDGHRLALITRPVKGLAFEERVIVPRKGLSEVRKIVDGLGDKEVGFDIVEGFLVVETGDSKLAMRLIDGEFPDYNAVMPKDKGVEALVPNVPLVQCLRRVALMVTDKNKCVTLDFSKNRLRISSSSPELGEANEEIEITYNGKPLSVGFNAIYLLEIAASLKENQNVIIDLHGELGPGVFHAEGDDAYTGVVMPMRLA